MERIAIDWSVTGAVGTEVDPADYQGLTRDEIVTKLKADVTKDFKEAVHPYFKALYYADMILEATAGLPIDPAA